MPPDKNDYIFGRHPVLDLLKSDENKINKVWLLKGSSGSIIDEILRRVREQKIVFQWVDRRRMGEFVSGKNTQGVVARVSEFEYTSYDDLFQKGFPSPLLLLDGIEDPHNLGAIIRSAAFFGVKAVVIPRWRSAGMSGTVLKTSAGGMAKVPLVQVANLGQTILDLKKRDYWVYGAHLEGNNCASFSFNEPFALVIGAEGSGLHRLVKERCDELVQIPGTGQMESLNASCSAGIFLYEIFRKNLK